MSSPLCPRRLLETQVERATEVKFYTLGVDVYEGDIYSTSDESVIKSSFISS